MFLKTLGSKDGIEGLGETFNLSYHMINSDGKSQSYNGKYIILNHNVLIYLPKLLGQRK